MGVALQCFAHGAHEEAHETEFDAVRLFELFAQLLAHGDDFRKVDLIERSQHRNRVLRLHQTFRDARAHAGHRHAFFGARASRSRCARFTRCGLRRALIIHQIFLGDLATTATAFDFRGIDLFFVRHALRSG